MHHVRVRCLQVLVVAVGLRPSSLGVPGATYEIPPTCELSGDFRKSGYPL